VARRDLSALLPSIFYGALSIVIPAKAGIQAVAIRRRKRRHSSESWDPS
jgi:hypothetical protein